jgi:hypothetical protein
MVKMSPFRSRYLAALGATVAASAAPYGYTLTIWTSGAVLSHARGIPDTLDALLFLVGAVTAFGGIAAVTISRAPERIVPRPAHSAIWGGLHFVSVGLAIAAASTVAHLVTNTAAWPLAGFVATAIYLLASASQLALARAAVDRASRGLHGR